MDDIKYPERIERMIDVMVCLPKNAWGLVLLDVEKEIGTVALQRIISQTYEIESANVLGKGKGAEKENGRARQARQTIVKEMPPSA